jgi:hypothetical protein
MPSESETAKFMLSAVSAERHAVKLRLSQMPDDEIPPHTLTPCLRHKTDNCRLTGRADPELCFLRGTNIIYI